MKLKGDSKLKGKLTRSLRNGIRNLVSFHASSQKSENLHFDGLVLCKAYEVLGEKVQKIYVSWQWRGFKEKLILEKVYGKSFTTVLDEVHFVSPTPGPPGKPFFPQGMSFGPS